MVVDILDNALVLRFKSKLAKEERVAAGGGDPSRPLTGARVGGRCETQSCTNRETRGFAERLRVFLEDHCNPHLTPPTSNTSNFSSIDPNALKLVLLEI